MSDIPFARAMINELVEELAAIGHELDMLATRQTAAMARLSTALTMLDREKPAFRARRKYRKLTDEEGYRARQMRDEGMQVVDIAKVLKTNPGRVSDAINE